MKELVFITAGLILLAVNGAQAQNARNCADRAQVGERLNDGYGEARQSIGLGANNAVVEVFASSETGTWTFTVTMPTGMTCLVASGRAYEELKEELAPASENDS